VLYLLIKTIVSGLLVALISETARRYPGWGGLVASLPLVSILAMLWLYLDGGDRMEVAAFATSTFWFVLASLPMFLILAALIRSGASFWLALAVSLGAALALYAIFLWSAPKLGIKL
jgi:hypothetical protein